MRKQAGITFWGFAYVVGTLVLVAVIGMKLFPAYEEYFAVKKVIQRIGNEAGFDSMTPAQIKDEFDKGAVIDNINTVKGEDLLVEKKDEGVIVSVAYQVTVPMFGNASALLDFSATTDKSAGKKSPSVN